MTETRKIPARAARPRHDGFDGARRRTFLAALGKSGCLSDAARKAGVSRPTVYAHQARDKAFARQCELALQMAATDVELHAWERGVVGVEEPIVYRGEIIGTRLKRSDAILRLLLQGANRKKYGPNPGFTRRRLHKLERQRIEREVRDEHRVLQKTDEQRREELVVALDRRLGLLAARQAKRMTAQGWRQVDEHWIPPNFVQVGPTPRFPDEMPGLAHEVTTTDGEMPTLAQVLGDDAPEGG